MSKSYPVRGVSDVTNFLGAVSKRLQTNGIRAALNASADPLVAAIRERAPKDTGKMAKSIKKGSSRKNQDGTISISVRPDPKNDHAFLALFHEYGVSPHLISVQEDEKPTRRKRDGTVKPYSMKLINRMEKGGSLRIGEHFVGPVVRHPGHRAQPFMRPGLDASAEDIVLTFGRKLRDYVEKKTSVSFPSGDE